MKLFNNVLERIDHYWETLSSRHQLIYRRTLFLGFFVLVTLIFYYSSGRHKIEIKKADRIEKEVVLDTDTLEKDIRASVESQLDTALMDQKKVLETAQEKQQKELEALKSLLYSMKEQQQRTTAQQVSTTDKSSDYSAYPPPPHVVEPTEKGEALQTPVEKQPLPPPAIASVNHSNEKKWLEGSKADEIFLPPSFMPAKLLTGIDALSSELGQDNPETIIFRVQAPAVLPNSLKANLRGCFVVGNAVGSLAKERVQVRLVSLHCMALSGEAVIDEPIKGFVTDEDGKRDMAGVVISKAGGLLARTFFASFVGGIGGAANQISTTDIISGGGILQTHSLKDTVANSAGKGFQAGTDELKKYYMRLAKMAMPVVEVLSGKPVTVVIQEGINLKIKETSAHDHSEV